MSKLFLSMGFFFAFGQFMSPINTEAMLLGEQGSEYGDDADVNLDATIQTTPSERAKAAAAGVSDIVSGFNVKTVTPQEVEKLIGRCDLSEQKEGVASWVYIGLLKELTGDITKVIVNYLPEDDACSAINLTIDAIQSQDKKNEFISQILRCLKKYKNSVATAIVENNTLEYLDMSTANVLIRCRKIDRKRRRVGIVRSWLLEELIEKEAWSPIERLVADMPDEKLKSITLDEFKFFDCHCDVEPIVDRMTNSAHVVDALSLGFAEFLVSSKGAVVLEKLLEYPKFKYLADWSVAKCEMTLDLARVIINHVNERNKYAVLGGLSLDSDDAVSFIRELLESSKIDANSIVDSQVKITPELAKLIIGRVSNVNGRKIMERLLDNSNLGALKDFIKNKCNKEMQKVLADWITNIK